MKKILSIVVLGVILSLGLTSCSDDFLSLDPHQSFDAKDAFRSPKDITNALNATYDGFGQSGFWGRNVVALGDIAGDNCYMTGSSGHYDGIYLYAIVEQNADLEAIWYRGYQAIDRATKVIKYATPMLDEPTVTAGEKAELRSAIAQAHGIRALTSFYMVNIFGLPYNPAGSNDGLGIVLVKENPIEITDQISRSTVAETYTYILDEIAAARSWYAQTTASPDAYYFTPAAVDALEARVRLFMGNWAAAITAAEDALKNSGATLVSDGATYYDMWGSTALTSEDIFTLTYSSDDNLSANSINTLYGSYNGRANQDLMALFAATDYRRSLFGDATKSDRPMKHRGLPTSAATSNIPVFRASEMYLIIAEANANLDQIPLAQDALFEIAQRNTALIKADLPSVKADLLDFIQTERRRELFQEGHRWFDLRRTRSLMNRTGRKAITNYAVYEFAYPIPAYEVNASGLQQNTGWDAKLPQ